jgi:hypothetical protein
MNGCYVGRGPLLVSIFGTGGGFFTLSGESEVNLDFEEDNESVIDARNGVNERTDWYVRNYRVRVVAECFRIQPESLELLLKANRNSVVGGAGAKDLPNPLTVARSYLIEPNMAVTNVTDDLGAVVTASLYTVDPVFGTVRFNGVGGFTQPFTVNYMGGGFEQFALAGTQQIDVEAMVQITNKIDGSKSLAHFYRLALDLTDAIKLVGKAFSSMTVRLQATPDTSQPLDPSLGQYGRIILL